MILLGVAGGDTMPPKQQAVGRCGTRLLWMWTNGGALGGGGGLPPAAAGEGPMRLRGGGDEHGGRDAVFVDGSDGAGKGGEESSSSFKSLAEVISEPDVSDAEHKQRGDSLLRSASLGPA